MLSAFDLTHCSTDELSAYIDGELDHDREQQMEDHLASCEACISELNWQKQFLCDLTASLMDERDIEMPPDFAKHVTVKAEASVNGIRGRGELYNALLIGFSLLLIAFVALSVGAGESAMQADGAFDQFTAVAGFAFQLLHSVLVALAVI